MNRKRVALTKSSYLFADSVAVPQSIPYAQSLIDRPYLAHQTNLRLVGVSDSGRRSNVFCDCSCSVQAHRASVAL